MSGQFDGVADGIELTDPNFGVGASALIQNVSLLSVSFRIQLRTALVSNGQILYIRNNNAGPNAVNSRLEIQLSAGTGPGAVQCIARAPDTMAGASVFSTGTIPVDATDDAPHILVVVTIDYPNDTIRFYIDGVLDSTHPALGLAAVTDNTPSGQAAISMDLGGFPPPNSFFPGKLSDFRIYQGHLLSAAEVRSMFYQTGHDLITGPSGSLVLRYAMDEALGGTAMTTANIKDSSPGRIIGSPFGIQGAPVFRDYDESFVQAQP